MTQITALCTERPDDAPLDDRGGDRGLGVRTEAAGGITNCAGAGRCGYTTRPELAYAYTRLLTQDQHNGRTYNLHGEAITQYELAEYLNRAFGTDLTYPR